MKFNSVDEVLDYEKNTNSSKAKLLIGMGTCGIAAGAKKVMEIFQKELETKGLTSIEIKPVGCLGLCFSEPNVEVQVPGMPSILYGKVNKDVAKQIVNQHLVREVVLDSNIYDKPYIDIFEQEGGSHE